MRETLQTILLVWMVQADPPSALAQEPGVVGGVSGGVLDERAKAMGLTLEYDTPPKLIKGSRPTYPKGALKKGIEGTVLVEIVIDRAGRVSDTHVLESVPELDAAAVKCVKGWRFHPAKKQGQPVATVARAPVTFRLPESALQTQTLPQVAEQVPKNALGQENRVGALYFDPQGADFTSWVNQFKHETYLHWLLPEAAKKGAQGCTQFRVTFSRSGTIQSLQVTRPSHRKPLDQAAEAALRDSRLLPLPGDYRAQSLTVEVAFFYNSQPAQQPRLGCSGTQPRPDLFDQLSGTWDWGDQPETCVQNPHSISFSPDGAYMTLTYRHAIEGVTGHVSVVRYQILKRDASSLRAAIVDPPETRRTEAGDLVVWDLILTGRDEYRWHATHWPETTGTKRLVRCSSP